MKPKIQLEPVRGFRDILAPDSEALTYLANRFRKIARLHGYREVIPPTLERFELFALKSGEEIRRSMYVFKDKAGREVALRPEATASIARLYLKHLRHLPKPVRLYYVVSCFRYEEPQFGRYREFFQAGVELIGAPSPLGDVEVIQLLVKFYKDIGMANRIQLVIGNTELYRKIFNRFNVPEEVQDHILHLMDKKEYDRAIDVATEYSGELASTLKALWDVAIAEKPSDFDRVKAIVEPVEPEAVKAIEDLKFIYEVLREYNIDVKIDFSFARGLAYYTGVIFEVKVPGFPVSIAGGGRYDTLIALYGGENMPSTGFAIGLDRTLLAMRHLGIEPENRINPSPKAAIVVLDENAISYALRVQEHLVDWDVEAPLFYGKKLGKLLPSLAEQGYDYAIIIGSREVAAGVVSVRDLKSKRQREVRLKELGYVVSYGLV